MANRSIPKTMIFDAAAMLAVDVPISEVARQLDVARETVRSWAKTPEAQQQIRDVRDGVQQATRHMAVADRVRRIRQAQRMVDRLLDLIDKRQAEAISDPNALPQETTGLMAAEVTTKTQTSASGATTVSVTRKVLHDASVHQELRRWLEYVAREKGELLDSVKVTHGGTVEVEHRRYDFSALSEGELEELARIGQKAVAQEMAP